MPEGLGMTGHFLYIGQKWWGSKQIGLGGAVRCKAFSESYQKRRLKTNVFSSSCVSMPLTMLRITASRTHQAARSETPS